MTFYQVVDSDSVCCRFVGERIVHIECELLEFADCHGWFELSAFAAEDASLVVTIVFKHCEARLDDHVRMCVGRQLDELDRFLFNFDVATILPHSDIAQAYYEKAAEMMMAKLRGVEVVHCRERRYEAKGLIHRLRALIGFRH